MSRDLDQAPLVQRRRDAAAAIRRRMVRHIAAGGTTDFAPDVLVNEPACYTDPARADLEKRKLFLEQPLVVGFSRDIPTPGSCLVFEDAGPSIVIVRGADGVARGFLNMCMHRASKLVPAQADGAPECVTRLTCPFHAWTYTLDGALVGIPGRAGFDGIDPAERRLIAVPLVEWNGLIFVRPTPGAAAIDAPAFLQGFADELMLVDFAAAAPVRRSRLTAECHWKVALDTYAEGYHFAVLHASSIGTSHYSNVAVFDDFAPHWRINFPDKGLRALVDQPEHAWPDAEYGGIHYLFPNTVLVIGSSGRNTFVRMFRLFPGPTPGAMSCRIDVYEIGGTAGDDPSPAFSQDDAESDVTKEDYRVAVDGYRNLVTAPPGFTVVYGRNEPALQAVHRHIAAALGIQL
jgi:nitrite reductase/ring-hydroxylating ferredoxin subunit